MTVGQRIAQKRKEKGLSQEALGERLGVSRQAIYKWESDAALPEIEKLVNLSREFSVSIDWLLGEGDEAKELTPEQLRMVEEIVGRYLAAQPAQETTPDQIPDASGKRAETRGKSLNWIVSVILKVAAFIVALNLGVLLLWRQNELEERYRSLQNSISAVSGDVNSQIANITNRVEAVLQSQNSLTAEQSAQVASADYRANTVTVEARVLPRTYVEGMEAEFILDSAGQTVTIPGTLGADHAFTARLTGPLSDSVTLSVAFLTGEQRQTQVLEQFSYLYSESLPGADVEHGQLWGTRGGVDEYTWVRVEENTKSGAKIAQLRVGLFRDWKLLAWYEPVEGIPPNMSGFDEQRDRFFRLEGEWSMEPGHVYCVAAVVTDSFGREQVHNSFPVKYDEDRDFYEFYSPDGTVSFTGDPADWDY